jgi:hypothetical protein
LILVLDLFQYTLISEAVKTIADNDVIMERGVNRPQRNKDLLGNMPVFF